MQLPSKTPKQGTCDKLLADAVDFPTPDGSKNRLFLICAKTGYSLAEVHIFATIHTKYDERLFVELRVLYQKTTKISRHQCAMI